MPDVPTVTLNSGHHIPQLGFGVFKVPQQETRDVVSTAFEVGYRSIDTAAMYGNEEGVGRAIAESGLPREELFITTKLNNDAHGYERALAAFEASRAKLGVDYLDLYLIHWPLPAQDRYVDTWKAFVKLQRDGVVRSIGVSNFEPAHLARVADETGVTPALNQVELHPYLIQEQVREYDLSHGIVTEAWSPIARGGDLLQDRVIASLAEKYGKTPAQIVLRWHLELGNVVIPKSVNPGRMASNLDLFGFALDEHDHADIAGLDSGHRVGDDPDTLE